MTEQDYPCSPLVAANAIVARYLAEKESLDEAALHLASVLLACTHWRVDDDEWLGSFASLSINAELEPIVHRLRVFLSQAAPFLFRHHLGELLQRRSSSLDAGATAKRAGLLERAQQIVRRVDTHRIMRSIADDAA